MDEVLSAIAAALAGKVAETTFEGGKKAFAALKSLVMSRFRDDEDARVALAIAQRDPDQEPAVAELTRAIARICAADPGFAAQLRRLWAQATSQSVTNTVIGNVGGHVIQAADIHGDINF